ncbi:PAAR-like domain-containing protein [Corallococcus terminator]
MGRVYANGRSILHKGDGNTHTSAAPDVCKVPTPGGPVPTPFVNSAEDSMLSKGSTSVTISGHPVALTSSELSASSGDEPGTAGGLISSKLKGKMAWGSGSVDVKIEGRGVVRYLDVTLHNGNTFNTTFISAGGTGLAYGDDTRCTACGKPLDVHRVHETPEVVAHVETVFTELMKRLHAQRPLIDEFLRLRERRNSLERDSLGRFKEALAHLEPQKLRRNELLTHLKSAAVDGKATIISQLSALQEELKTKEEGLAKQRAEERKHIQVIEQEMNSVNARLKGMSPVLRPDKNVRTYVQGYMLGVCVCKCPQSPRMLVACSGDSAPGFQEAVATTRFTLVESFRASESQMKELLNQGRDKWECAAPKILQAGGASGHQVKAMSERYFSPIMTSTVGVAFSVMDVNGARSVEKEFSHGESVPSCDTCQRLLPEMLCNHSKECA